MGSKSPSTNSAVSCAMALLLLGFVSSNIDQDRAECTDQMIGLATCLPYVGGEAKSPTIDCCSALKLVLQKSKKCLCLVIKDRDDPNLGLKINLTLALGLPEVCHSPANTKECVELLHLPPNSQEAKDFLGLNSTGSNITEPPAVSGKNPPGKNDGGIRRQWLGVEIFVWFFFSSLLLTSIW